MTDFKSSRTIVRASTIAGGDAANTHNFSGSVFLHDLAAGVTASAPSTLAITNDNQLVVTAIAGGGGGGGSPGAPLTSVQFNNGGAFGGSSNFLWASDILTLGGTSATAVRLTGTFHQTGSFTLQWAGSGTPFNVGDDTDISGRIGRAEIGFFGQTDAAAFSHRDHATLTQFGVACAPTGLFLNAREDFGSGIHFSIGGVVGAFTQDKMIINRDGDVGIGDIYSPSSNLDVSGAVRFGGGDTPVTHQMTGTTDLSGAVVGEPTLIVSGAGPFGYQGDPANQAYSVKIDEDKDACMVVGMAHIGMADLDPAIYTWAPDAAFFGHRDMFALALPQWALLQRATGQTDINAYNGRDLTFRIGTNIYAKIDGASGFFAVGNVAPAVLDSKFQVDGATHLGMDAADFHQVTGTVAFSGTLLATGAGGPCETAISALGSISASCGISSSFFQGDGSGLTNLPGGGGGTPQGNDTTIQFNDGGAFGGNDNLTYQKLLSRVSLTGTLMHTGSSQLSGGLTILSSTFGPIPFSVADDEPISARIGKAHVGHDGTNTNFAIFSHRQAATTTAFGILQTGGGATTLNAGISSEIDFTEGGIGPDEGGPGTRHMTMRLDGTFLGYGIGIGTNYDPGALHNLALSLDVSGSTRFGGGHTTSVCENKPQHIFTGSLRQHSGSVKLTYRELDFHTAGGEYTASLCDYTIVYRSSPPVASQIIVQLPHANAMGVDSQGHTYVIKQTWVSGSVIGVGPQLAAGLGVKPSGSDQIDNEGAGVVKECGAAEGSLTLVSNGIDRWWLV